jgi:drug/metabolite transporter (DMT)-like permease
VLSGAVVGPVLLLLGLHQLSAVVASLLLNLEAPFTILLAVWFFRDHVGGDPVCW